MRWLKFQIESAVEIAWFFVSVAVLTLCEPGLLIVGPFLWWVL